MARTCATTTTLVVHAPMLIMHYVLCTNCCDSPLNPEVPLSESSPVVNLEKYEARRTTTVRHRTMHRVWPFCVISTYLHVFYGEV